MRELMLEIAGWKWRARQEASGILLACLELVHTSQLIHNRRGGWNCKDRARFWSHESGVRSLELDKSQLPANLPERRERLIEIFAGMGS